MQLRISKAKPNPAGKDFFAVNIPASQLAAEWIDISNEGSRGNPTGITLWHQEYPTATSPRMTIAYTFGSFVLEAGQTVRVHSGAGPLASINVSDTNGAYWHTFTGKGYLWNNGRPDKPMLTSPSGDVIDWAEYTTAPDGRILVRNANNRLQ